LPSLCVGEIDPNLNETLARFDIHGVCRHCQSKLALRLLASSRNFRQCKILSDISTFQNSATATASYGSGSSHTHAGPNHTHSGPNHTHSAPSHTHTGPSHTHAAGSWTGNAMNLDLKYAGVIIAAKD